MLRTSSLDELNEQLVEEYAITNIERKLQRQNRKAFNKTNNELGRKHYER